MNFYEINVAEINSEGDILLAASVLASLSATASQAAIQVSGAGSASVSIAAEMGAWRLADDVSALILTASGGLGYAQLSNDAGLLEITIQAGLRYHQLANAVTACTLSADGAGAHASMGIDQISLTIAVTPPPLHMEPGDTVFAAAKAGGIAMSSAFVEPEIQWRSALQAKANAQKVGVVIATAIDA